MSPAALYVHHRSKEELLYLISLDGHRRVLSLVRDAITGGGSAADQLRGAIHAFAVYHAERHTEARVVNYELAALSPDHLDEIRALRHEIDAELRNLVQAGGSEFLRPRALMASVALLSLGIDIARWYREDGLWSPQDLADGYAEMALQIVGARQL